MPTPVLSSELRGARERSSWAGIRSPRRGAHLCQWFSLAASGRNCPVSLETVRIYYKIFRNSLSGGLMRKCLGGGGPWGWPGGGTHR